MLSEEGTMSAEYVVTIFVGNSALLCLGLLLGLLLGVLLAHARTFKHGFGLLEAHPGRTDIPAIASHGPAPHRP